MNDPHETAIIFLKQVMKARSIVLPEKITLETDNFPDGKRKISCRIPLVNHNIPPRDETGFGEFSIFSPDERTRFCFERPEREDTTRITSISPGFSVQIQRLKSSPSLSYILHPGRISLIVYDSCDDLGGLRSGTLRVLHGSGNGISTFSKIYK